MTPKKVSNKKKLENQVAELQAEVEKLKGLLKGAAHDADPWQQIKRFFTGGA